MRRNLGIALLVLSAFTGTLAFRLVTPAVAFYTRDVLGSAMVHISIISASFILARSLSALFSGLLVEKRKKLVYLGALAMAGNAFAVNLYPMAASWLQVTGIKLLNGLLNGIAWPIAQFVVAVTSPRDVRSRVTAVYFISGNLAGLLGNYTYAITQRLGLRVQMHIASTFFLLTAILMMTSYHLLYEGITPRREGKAREAPPINPRVALTASALVSLLTAFTSGEVTYIYVAETLDMERGKVATLIGTVGFLATLLSYIPSKFADLGSERRVIAVVALLAGISPLLVAIKSIWTVPLGIFLGIFAAQAFRPVVRSVLVSAKRASAAIGAVNAVANISTTAGQLLFGAAYPLGEIVVLGVVLKVAPLLFAPASFLLLGIATKVHKRR
ncbi:MFS transporter [Pyrococcus yayanosii]|uniref:Transporter, major facilitator family n=1 Tax=Pyrococcus yayanosii (strain CH1 / JCM 16557) TaxID=529709 RepID=F8AI21_PYRYC|nr:MFS transporter [Pyrococcus yayanosii]AEH25486.1 transporter, major facilitator family [Pyrococcus yayanosii CH1]